MAYNPYASIGAPQWAANGKHPRQTPSHYQHAPMWGYPAWPPSPYSFNSPLPMAYPSPQHAMYYTASPQYAVNGYYLHPAVNHSDMSSRDSRSTTSSTQGTAELKQQSEADHRVMQWARSVSRSLRQTPVREQSRAKYDYHTPMSDRVPDLSHSASRTPAKLQTPKTPTAGCYAKGYPLRGSMTAPHLGSGQKQGHHQLRRETRTISAPSALSAPAKLPSIADWPSVTSVPSDLGGGLLEMASMTSADDSESTYTSDSEESASETDSESGSDSNSAFNADSVSEHEWELKTEINKKVSPPPRDLAHDYEMQAQAFRMAGLRQCRLCRHWTAYPEDHVCPVLEHHLRIARNGLGS